MATEFEITPSAVRTAEELHISPNGPLSMYTTIPLDKRGRHAAYADDQLEYSILYFPDCNTSNLGHHETVSVIRHTDDEYSDESKRLLEKVSSLTIGKAALAEYKHQKSEYKKTIPFDLEKPSLRSRCNDLGLPYMAILFSCAPDAPEITHTTLHLPAFARPKKAFGGFQDATKTGDIQFYNSNVDNADRVTFWKRVLPRAVS